MKLRHNNSNGRQILRFSWYLVVCLLLLLVLPAQISATQEPRGAHSSIDIENAVNILRSVGASRICHPSTHEFTPLLPKCDDNTVKEKADLFLEEGYGHRVTTESESENPDSGGGEPADTEFYIFNGLMAALCVTTAALAAGLTMGMLSLDPLMLTIKMRAGATKAERDQAKQLLPLVQQHHRLLVSLLLLNSISNEALPIFLDKLVPSIVAVILSVTLVLFFGEIIPSAIFTGPKQMSIASKMVPLVRTIMILLSPLAYPIAKLLDIFLHDEDDESGMSLFNRGELSALIRIQYEERLATKTRRKAEAAKLANDLSLRNVDNLLSIRSVDSSTKRAIKHELENHYNGSMTRKEPTLNSSSTGRRTLLKPTPSWHQDEVTLVEGALSMKVKRAIDAYTPMRDVFTVPFDMVLNEANVVNIYSRGYSRVPVYLRRAGEDLVAKDTKGKSAIDESVICGIDKSAICGILMTKQLIVVNASDKRSISTMPLQRPFCIPQSINLVELINIFQTGGTRTCTKGAPAGHMAFLCVHPEKGNKALDKGEPIPISAGLMGVITLEDVLEELLQEEIYDEMDKGEFEAFRRAQWALEKWKRFIRKKREAQARGIAPDSSGASMMVKVVNQATATAHSAAEAGGTGTDVELGAKASDGGNAESSSLLPPRADKSDNDKTVSYGSSSLPEFS